MNVSILKSFLLIIGSPRSGSTVLGSIINSHPQAIIANETSASRFLWHGLSKEKIYNIINQNVMSHENSNLMYSGYKPIPKTITSDVKHSLILGEKIWNPATLFIHGKKDLIYDLSRTLELPIQFINTIRNPYDVIATMHVKSGAPIADRISWFFMHCEAVDVISKRYSSSEFMHVYHEDLITNPDQEITSICNFLNIPICEGHLKIVRNNLFSQPNKSRNSVNWNDEDILRISKKIENFEFLHKYI